MAFYHPDLVHEVLLMFQSGCKILLSNLSQESIYIHRKQKGSNYSTRANSFYRVEVGKAVARVQKKSTQAEVKNREIRINCQQKRCFI